MTTLQTAVAALAAVAQPAEADEANNGSAITPETIAAFQQQAADLAADGQAFRQERADLLSDLSGLPHDNAAQHTARTQLDPFIPRLKALQKTITALVRKANRARDVAEKVLAIA